MGPLEGLLRLRWEIVFRGGFFLILNVVYLLRVGYVGNQ